MESGIEDLHPHSPSMEQPTDQTPSQQDSFEEKSSDVEEKRSEEKGKTFYFHLDSHIQRPDRNLSCWYGADRRNGIRDI